MVGAVDCKLRVYLLIEYMRDGALEDVFSMFFIHVVARTHRNAERGRCSNDESCHSESFEGNCTAGFLYNVRYVIAVMLQAVKAINYIHAEGVSQLFVWLVCSTAPFSLSTATLNQGICCFAPTDIEEDIEY